MKKILLILYVLLVGFILFGCSDSPKEYKENDFQEVLEDVGINKTPTEIKSMIKNHEKNRYL